MKAAKGSKADLEKKSQGLPAGWRALWDAKQSSYYYGNASTKVCTGLHWAHADWPGIL